ncbi:Transcription initiation factor TFIID subunit 8, partial [Mucuna pruriens]
MSNGGGKTGRQLEQPGTWRRRKVGGGDDFARAIAKIAVAQVCEGEGFQAFQQSALEALSDIVARYILNVGKSAHYHANFSGRTECNAFDVIQGLEDMGSAQGFAGAADVDHCLESSGVIREIVHFVNGADPVMFAHPIPRFPVVKERVLNPSFLQRGEEPPGEHIPAWLPAFPDPQTYGQSPAVNGRGTEPCAAKFEQERENGKGEWPVLNLQQQMVSNMFGKSALIDPADAKAKRVAAESNPFLAAPLKIVDKEVASGPPPAKLFNDVALDNPVVENFVEKEPVSALKTFAPAIEAMKSTCCDSKEDQKKFSVNEKPTVRFKIGVKNKLLGRSIGLIPQKEEHKKTLPWFAMEDEKDDRKRRAEKILRESLENPDQLVQLICILDQENVRIASSGIFKSSFEFGWERGCSWSLQWQIEVFKFAGGREVVRRQGRRLFKLAGREGLCQSSECSNETGGNREERNEKEGDKDGKTKFLLFEKRIS